MKRKLGQGLRSLPKRWFRCTGCGKTVPTNHDHLSRNSVCCPEMKYVPVQPESVQTAGRRIGLWWINYSLLRWHQFLVDKQAFGDKWVVIHSYGPYNLIEEERESAISMTAGGDVCDTQEEALVVLEYLIAQQRLTEDNRPTDIL